MSNNELREALLTADFSVISSILRERGLYVEMWSAYDYPERDDLTLDQRKQVLEAVFDNFDWSEVNWSIEDTAEDMFPQEKTDE